MSPGILIALAAAAMLLPLPLSAQETAPEARQWIVEDELAVERLAPGVWLHVSYQEMEDWGRVGANGLLVVGDGEAALVDTPWTGEQTTALMEFSATVLEAPVTAVVPTHSHGDCAGGLAAAHGQGARSWAHEKTAALAREAGEEPPETVFGDRLELEVGGRTFELRHLGPGHTVDNIVVWIPDRRMVFGGCLVKSATSRTMGYIGEADLERWPDTLDRLVAGYPEARRIVPGHGRPGGWETVERTRELLAGASESD